MSTEGTFPLDECKPRYCGTCGQFFNEGSETHNIWCEPVRRMMVQPVIVDCPQCKGTGKRNGPTPGLWTISLNVCETCMGTGLLNSKALPPPQSA